MVVIGVLMGVLIAQQVYAYMKLAKRLFVAAFAVFIGINILMLVLNSSPLDKTVTNLAIRGMFFLILISAAIKGWLATIFLSKSNSTTLKDVFIKNKNKKFLPFVSYVGILLILLILT